jgi:transcriptional regulator with XRE-family HTH domain
MRLQANQQPLHRTLLGQRIRKHRLRKKLTQEKTAEAAMLDAKYFGEVERGEAAISIDRLVNIAAALGTTVRELTRDF